MAQIIDGKAIARLQWDKLKKLISNVRERQPQFLPGLVIVQVGNRQDSNVYIRNKLRAAEYIGISARLLKLDSKTDQATLIDRVKMLNADSTVHGIILQLPMDVINPMDTEQVINTIKSDKDVDGLTVLNAGRLARGELENTIVPCTPQGCLELLKTTGIEVAGKHCVVLGRSKIVGGPASSLFLWNNATVTTCHSKTTNLPDICRSADILLVAIGKPNFVKGSWLKPGVVVIDCGINCIEGEARKLVGDVDFEEACKIASFITPVPGGVGPMTVAMLMKNTVSACLKAGMCCRSWRLAIRTPTCQRPMPSDIEISKSHCPSSIVKIAEAIGIEPTELELYGKYKAKVSLDIMKRLNNVKLGKYILVTSMTPTASGIGKSTLTIGLAQAFNTCLNMNAMACIRQPSLGPTFGIKGGAAGGGYSQVVPMDEFNLHLTGDIHAVVAATNLLAAAIDARIFHERTQKTDVLYNRMVTNKIGTAEFSEVQKMRLQKLSINKKHPDDLSPAEREQFTRLNIDPKTITLNRVIDTNDRFLRTVTIGQSPSEKHMTRQCRFDIAAASELMVILSMSTSLSDMCERLRKIVVALDTSGAPVTAEDLGVSGALAVLLKVAIEPTLMQTIEGSPVLIHTGPFANIAHGNSSILSDIIGLKLVGPNGVVITESGFGADIGFEKFIDIKCRTSRLKPDLVILTVTIEALKLQGTSDGTDNGIANSENNFLDIIERGCLNMARHIRNIKKFGLKVVVAINRFIADTEIELAFVKRKALEAGASECAVCTNWSDGGKGAYDLAISVLKACSHDSNDFKFLYDLHEPLESKIEKIATEIYGAAKVVFSPAATEAMNKLKKQGFNQLPVCMAKTPLSFSMDPKILGVPEGYELPIREVKVFAGAGFVYAIVGDIQTMPGLPIRPNFYDIQLDPITGDVNGIS